MHPLARHATSHLRPATLTDLHLQDDITRACNLAYAAGTRVEHYTDDPDTAYRLNALIAEATIALEEAEEHLIAGGDLSPATRGAWTAVDRASHAAGHFPHNPTRRQRAAQRTVVDLRDAARHAFNSLREADRHRAAQTPDTQEKDR